MAFCVPFLVTAFLVARPSPMMQSEEPATPVAVADADSAAALEADRRALIAHEADRPARMSAALNLIESDLAYLAEQVRTATNDEVVLAILEAVEIRPPTAEGGVELVSATLDRAARDANGIVPRALQTLKALDRAAPTVVRPWLLAALEDENSGRARVAAEVLARTGDLAVVGPLLEVLAGTEGVGDLAAAAGAGLTDLLGPRLGTDHAAWSTFWQTCTGKSRERILRDVLESERAESVTALDLKDREIVRLKRSADAGDAARLVKNLEHEIAGVRRFSAELLARGFDEAEIAAARPIVLSRLGGDVETPSVRALLLLLLKRLDSTTEATRPDAERDAVLARHLASDDPEVLLAAIEVAEAFPVKQVRDAALEALRRSAHVGFPSNVRIALVGAAAKSRLNLPAGVEELGRILREDDSVDVRVAAATTLGSLGSADSGPELLRALIEDTDWRVRRRAASVLHLVTGAEALDALVTALEDEKPEVRSEVALAIAGSGHPGGAAALMARLDIEESLTVRAALVRSLGRIGVRAAINPLVEIVAAPEVGPANGAVDPAESALRTAAREALMAIAGEDPVAWKEIATALGDDAVDFKAIALVGHLRGLEAGGGDDPEAAAAILQARVAAARACVMAGDHDTALNVIGATSAVTPESGADRIPYADLSVCEGRARMARQDATGAADAFERALGLLGDDLPSRRFTVSVDLAAARLETGDAVAAEAALPKGAAPEGTPESAVRRRDSLAARLVSDSGSQSAAGRGA